MGHIFNEILYRPLLNIVILIYNFLPGKDLGLAIISLTILIRLILLPFSIKAARAQRKLAKLSPKINEINEKLKHDKQAQSAAIMQLYKEESVNPLLGCLPLLIQFPVLIALYRVFLSVSKPGSSLDLLYGFVSNPGVINKISLSMIDITTKNPLLPILAGGLQFLQSKISVVPQGGAAAGMNTQMLYFLPIMIIIITWNLPAGLALYFITTTLFSIFEQLYIKRKNE